MLYSSVQYFFHYFPLRIPSFILITVWKDIDSCFLSGWEVPPLYKLILQVSWSEQANNSSLIPA